MQSTPIGIGIVGFGGRMQRVVKLLADVAGPAVKTLYVASGSAACRDAAHAIADKPVVSTDERAMLADPAVSWVFIGSTNDHHRRQAIAALEAGKHVFCEKPVGISFDDCRAVAAAHAKTRLQFVVGFVLRYSPLYRKIVKLVHSGGIGRLVSLEFNETLDFNHGGFIAADWRRHTALSGGHLLEKCSHDMDIVNWIVGSTVSRVASFGGLNFFTPENAGRIEAIGSDAKGKPAYGTWDSRGGDNAFVSDKDIIDNQIAIFEYANGVRASFHTNLNSGLPERRMYLLGTEGAVRADLNHGVIEHRRIGFDTPTVIYDQRANAEMHGGGDIVMATELLATMTIGAATATPLSTGIDSAMACLAADQARVSGTVVSVPTIM